jgi:hypothetical protein
MSDEQQANFNGWAKVEVMGHQTHIGSVRTEAYGQAVMFRVDTPELPEREYILTEPEYCGGSWTPAGSTVRRMARPGVTALIGAGSIYRILPCTEAAAMKAIEQEGRAPLQLISLPEGKQLTAGAGSGNDDEDEDETDENAEDFEGDTVFRESRERA